jgi:hypothetical protein
MDAFEIDKILHAKIKPGQEFKAPITQKIESVNLRPNLIPEIITTNFNISQSSFPWAEMVLLGGVTILIITIIIEFPKSKNYHSFIGRRKNQHSIYQ